MTATPQQLTPTPADDHHRRSRVNITKPPRPLHHDPSVINFSVAGAPSALIMRPADAAVPSATREAAALSASAASAAGGRRC